MAAQPPPQPVTLHPNYPECTRASQRGEPSLTQWAHLAAESRLMHLNITGERLTAEITGSEKVYQKHDTETCMIARGLINTVKNTEKKFKDGI